MIGRFVWYGALASIGLLTTVLQIDIQGRWTLATATLVPQPLRNFAQVPITQAALAGTDSDAALLEAKRLVRRRPIPAEHLTLLAKAQVKAGQVEAATKTIQIAAQRGWRDPVAQEAMLRIAVGVGDKPEAARRYAALFLRSATSEALLREQGPAVLDEPDGLGQQTMTTVVVGGERWRALFLRRGVSVMPPAAFGAITAAAVKQGAMFDCQQLERTIKVLSRSDGGAADGLAAAASAGPCPQIAP